MKIIIKPLVIILTSCVLFAQEKSTEPTSKIAFAGIQIENVEPWVETELTKKMNSIFDGLSKDIFVPLQSVETLAQSEIQELFSEVTDSSFQKVADKTGAKYVFVGIFNNVSPDDRRIMVQGNFYRYNSQLKSKFRYEVLKYYERMNDEALVIKKQLVDSIPATSTPPTLRNMVIVFGTVLLLGIFFMTLTGTSVFAEGGDSGGLPTPTEN